MRSRLAPTPSGFLHAGNVVNFLVIDEIVRSNGGTLVLRIDDLDRSRVRDEYVSDIFTTLEWLGIEWHVGPTSASELPSWSQHTRMDHYRDALDVLMTEPCVYACVCTRSDWNEYAGIDCPASCRARAEVFQAGVTAVRLHLDGQPDATLWRRDGIPAYHLASVVDDDLWGVDVVVRGSDLEPSTAVQRRVSEILPGSAFQHARILHHPLIKENGQKLSKSAGSRAQPLVKSGETRDVLRSMAQAFVTDVGY